MGEWIVTAPDGRRVKITGDGEEPPTGDVLQEIFAQLPPLEPRDDGAPRAIDRDEEAAPTDDSGSEIERAATNGREEV